MKNFTSFVVVTLLFVHILNAQTIPFQAVARDTSGVLISNQNMSVRISIHDSTSTGTAVYKETQSVTTNSLGLLTLNIGGGTVVTGTFSGIHWGSGNKYVQLEVDPTGGSSYANLGTSQLQSVPYALYAPNGGAQPSGQIAYGTGSGTTSDTYFTRDALETTNLFSIGQHSATEFTIDTDKLQIKHGKDGVNSVSLLEVGDGSSLTMNGIPLNLGNQCVVAAVFDPRSNIVFGLSAQPDSVGLVSSDTDFNYGIVGSKHFSSYMDVSFNNGTTLNSLTVDTDGIHWQYRDTTRYTLPVRDGSAGQVLTTNGSGNSWITPNNPDNSMFTPSTGDNITVIPGTNIIAPVSGLSSLTITLPSSPTNNETVYFTFTNTITSLSFSGGTVVNPISTIGSVSAGSIKYWLTYSTSGGKWY